MGMSTFAAYWRRADAPGRKPDWIAVAIFFVIACAWSYFAARWGEIRLVGSLPRINGILLIGFGPVLGALAAGALRRDRGNWPAGFRGLDKRWSLIALLIPILVTGALGVKRFHVDPHLDAAIITATVVLACIGEEIGWREYLYNMFAGLPLWASALITWVLWLLWHMTFVLVVGDQLGQTYDLIYTLGLFVASFALAALVRTTRSSAIAAAWRTVAALPVPLWLAGVIAVLLAVATWKAAATVRRVTP